MTFVNCCTFYKLIFSLLWGHIMYDKRKLSFIDDHSRKVLLYGGMYMMTILVVDDDQNTRRLMQAILKRNYFNVLLANDGVEALDLMEKHHVDLAIVDVMMPRMDGYELTQTLRDGWPNLPILMVTAKQTPQDKRQGFLVGTDDYMTKPVDEEEMLLRIQALLRRAKIVFDQKLMVGDLTLDYNSLSIIKGKQVTALPQKEFLLLYKLLSYPNRIFTRLQLMDEIWGLESETDDHTLNVHINRLRERFKDEPSFEIVTVRGLGYKAVKQNESLY